MYNVSNAIGFVFNNLFHKTIYLKDIKLSHYNIVTIVTLDMTVGV